MSLFDPVERKSLADTFAPGTVFALLGARWEGLQSTEYGPRPQATVVCAPTGPESKAEAKAYRVWGTLAEQIEAMEDGDLPALVSIEKHGRARVWFPHEKLPETEAIAVDDADSSDIGADG